MKLQQLRCLCEVARQGLNITEAADKMHTSQPGVSKQIRLLEEELGVDVFVRHGKRVVAVTAPGQAILQVAERILQETAALKSICEEFAQEDVGSLTVATTHTQARYALPDTIVRFRQHYPKVRLSIKQGSPQQVAEMVARGEADIAIATEGIDQFPDLVMLPCYTWNRVVVVPHGHPLLAEPSLSLAALAAYPLITYDFTMAGRSRVNQAFAQAGLSMNVVLTAIDSDIIKVYVGLGLGVGILAKMAFDPQRDQGLQALDASHLFAESTTRLGLRRNSYLRRYAYDFIAWFAPHLDHEVVQQALAGG